MPEIAPPNLIGYHGTDAANVESIKAENFRLSEGEDMWFGKAAYFYADCQPYNSAEHAENWAVKSARIKGSTRLKFETFAVLKVVIQPQNLLDLTNDDGKAKFEKTKTKLRNEAPIKQGSWEDSKAIAFMVDMFDFDVLINDVVSRFELEIVYNLRSHTANSRIVSVYRPKTCIDTNKIVVIKNGPIP